MRVELIRGDVLMEHEHTFFDDTFFSALLNTDAPVRFTPKSASMEIVPYRNEL